MNKKWLVKKCKFGTEKCACETFDNEMPYENQLKQ